MTSREQRGGAGRRTSEDKTELIEATGLVLRRQVQADLRERSDGKRRILFFLEPV